MPSSLFRCGLDTYSGLRSALMCPLRMIALKERRFGLLNTGIYLILSGSSDRLMLPGSRPNEFLWLDMAQPSLSAPIRRNSSRDGGVGWGVLHKSTLSVCHVSSPTAKWVAKVPVISGDLHQSMTCPFSLGIFLQRKLWWDDLLPDGSAFREKHQLRLRVWAFPWTFTTKRPAH